MSVSAACISIDDPESLARIYPHQNEKHFPIVLGQMRQRIQLVKTWGIQPGERVLEIGCGQGDCTVALAAAVGNSGHVTAIDPASLDYGSPYTLGEAQAHLRASPIGSRITFEQADPLAFLPRNTETYTTAVLAQCIWYFASPSTLSAILSALALRVQRICVSEYALVAGDPRAAPHVLAVLAQAALECRKPTSESNVRTVMAPREIRSAAEVAGLRTVSEERIVPPEDMYDGRWEVGAVLADEFESEIRESVANERERAVVFAMRDAVRSAADSVKLKGESVHTMDIWIATFAK
ncbi:S-adenosyl-L-methionine-dependent methyltransferase [Wolfiporia cocos MD-104 SS10]|uniref:S-adenosyl-L-methionine-dependent methyltransferase n=1 Tax=Wolfiporia cocos (strain MD-104) TaxID=742152 RepID=A0A2H3JA85_WOLCO|nr:S-adenosyl-L-methionine-dependent methyltransferase [Wolfiporia cocos MD-104 SS10]